MIERSDVCATSCAALNQFWILMTDATGSFTRKYATASTATVTLSFVITCCDATGTACVCRLTCTIWLMNGGTKKMPGPFAPRHAAEPEDHPALVLLHDAHARRPRRHDRDDDDDDQQSDAAAAMCAF